MKHQSVTVARASQPALGELIAELLKTMLPDAANKKLSLTKPLQTLR